MDNVYDITDSSDWLDTPVAPLRSVEAALRCQVCKDFYNTPMITTCCHTFCSLCIRRCLTGDGKCPSCRSSDQEIRLRRNWAVQELVDAFQTARPSILKLGQDLLEAKEHSRPVIQKRKRVDTEIEEDPRGEVSQRTTRSRSRKSPKVQAEAQCGIDNCITIEVGEEGDFERDDGLSACPICGKRMKIEDVFLHLDTHNKDKMYSESWKSAQSVGRAPSPSKPSIRAMERLPSLSYSIMNENTLRKKISTLGIPNFGSKQLLIRRHTEWVNLWNANCDSSRPRSKRNLLHDLEIWEKTQGGGAPAAPSISSGASSVMAKDFDCSAWSASHGDDFRQLIAQARHKPIDSTNTIDDGTTRKKTTLDQIVASNLICGNLDRPPIADKGCR